MISVMVSNPTVSVHKTYSDVQISGRCIVSNGLLRALLRCKKALAPWILDMM